MGDCLRGVAGRSQHSGSQGDSTNVQVESKQYKRFAFTKIVVSVGTTKEVFYFIWSDVVIYFVH